MIEVTCTECGTIQQVLDDPDIVAVECCYCGVMFDVDLTHADEAKE